MRLSWASSDYSLVCCGDCLIITCLKISKLPSQFLKLPPLSVTPATGDETVSEPDNSPEHTVGCHVSYCGGYVGAITTHKRLLLWQRQTPSTTPEQAFATEISPSAQQEQVPAWTLLHSWRLIKRPVDVVFDNDDKHVLVADKTGDVLQYRICAKQRCPSPVVLLGHLSMLLSLTMSTCGKLVVSGDRDEKVRVSHYPRAHNIASFCLGHTEFVAQLRSLPSYETTLLSASGDGSLCLWNMTDGRELCRADTHLYSERHCIPGDDDGGASNSPTENSSSSHQNNSSTLAQTSSAQSSSINKNETTEEGVSPAACGSKDRVVPFNCAITAIAVTKSTTPSSGLDHDLVAVAFERSRCVVVYTCTGDSIHFLASTDTLKEAPASLMWLAENVFAVVFKYTEDNTNKDSSSKQPPILVYEWRDGQLFILPSHPLTVFAQQNQHRFSCVTSMDASVLFKQRYDNVAEYKKKKADRIQQQMEKTQPQTSASNENFSCKRIKLA